MERLVQIWVYKYVCLFEYALGCMCVCVFVCLCVSIYMPNYVFVGLHICVFGPCPCMFVRVFVCACMRLNECECALTCILMCV